MGNDKIKLRDKSFELVTRQELTHTLATRLGTNAMYYAGVKTVCFYVDDSNFTVTFH